MAPWHQFVFSLFLFVNVVFSSMSPYFSDTGKIGLFLNGCGSTSTCAIPVVKPSAASVVRRAFAFYTSTSSALSAGAITLNGNTLSTSQTTTGYAAYYQHSTWYNYAQEVTSIVSSLLGTQLQYNFTVSDTTAEGLILAVVFEDTAVYTTDNSVGLYFGGQAPAGDSFAVQLATPHVRNDTSRQLTFSVGISFSYQTASVTTQFSYISLNGQRISSTAGGQDDGQPLNGALITVGGYGDSRSNPTDPNALVVNERSDDELYSFEQLVPDGATTMNITSSNPSYDDNIFFAGLFATNQVISIGMPSPSPGTPSPRPSPSRAASPSPASPSPQLSKSSSPSPIASKSGSISRSASRSPSPVTASPSSSPSPSPSPAEPSPSPLPSPDMDQCEERRAEPATDRFVACDNARNREILAQYGCRDVEDCSQIVCEHTIPRNVIEEMDTYCRLT